jgi:hypothetical protein
MTIHGRQRLGRCVVNRGFGSKAHADHHRYRRRPHAQGDAPQRPNHKESGCRSRPALTHSNPFSGRHPAASRQGQVGRKSQRLSSRTNLARSKVQDIAAGCEGRQVEGAHSGSCRNCAQGTQAAIGESRHISPPRLRIRLQSVILSGAM